MGYKDDGVKEGGVKKKEGKKDKKDKKKRKHKSKDKKKVGRWVGVLCWWGAGGGTRMAWWRLGRFLQGGGAAGELQLGGAEWVVREW